MSRGRLGLRLRVFLFFALIGLGSTAIIGGAMWLAAARIGPDAVAPLVLFGGAAALAILLLTGWVWQLFDENVARAIETLSGELSATAQGGAAPPPDRARYLGDLGPAAQGVADALARARGEKGSAVAEAVDDVIAEKAQLEAVLRDLRECVLICNPSHEILLYNAEAQRLLGAEGEIGLGRSLFRLITEAPVVHALERLTNRFTSGRYRTHRDHLSVAVTCATRDGARTLQGRISLILDADETRVDGFVATFRDATALIADEAARDHLLREMLEDLRRPAANLRAAVETLTAAPDIDDAARGQFMGVLDAESRRLADRLDGMAEAFNELRVGGWSMNDMVSEALVDCVADRLRGSNAPEIAHVGPAHWVHCDSFTVVELLARIAQDLGREEVQRITMQAEPSGAHVFLDLGWTGPVADFADSDAWLDAPLSDALGTLNARDVLTHHRTALWTVTRPDGSRGLRLPLPPGVEDHANAPAESLPPRPEFYDFALLRRRVPADIRDRALSDTSFTVFDTETTGLFPSAGDEIVQIAGVRMLGNRVIRGESFERLVDPGRRIPAASTRIHGITDAMVTGQGDARAVLPAFHAFASGSVLVAHNAPFDMTFLKLKESVTGVRFDQPVLDTVLLSAWLFGQSADHTLDALAERFNVKIPEDLRHTALADALVTAEVLSGLVDVLGARGVRTLGEALSVSEEAGAIRRRQARY